ncbi:DUF899 domain-containing protein [Marinobacter caseinilyticus]|uniref:DUF899 domain-containing protein n=1 Tax=Marinobacter caseinilyticus TaxID=2692195 RepID=UPI00140A6D3D|nr:thioredoxin family protein [Marinobacter caseinilyticus]
MTNHPVVTHQQWLAARQQLLEKEKAFTRQRDELSAKRRGLPWEKVEKTYVFESERGRLTLTDLFAGLSQLIVYHFMFGADWEEGCPSCSFWADNFNGIDVHLAHRDIRLLAVSTAPIDRLRQYRERMGWSFQWVSCDGNDFNRDYQVTFSPEQSDVTYNYRPMPFSHPELPGVSVFFRDTDDTVYHTYSAYSRGIDLLNGAYNYMDIAPKGRDEDALPYTMAWLKRHDQYDD